MERISALNLRARNKVNPLSREDLNAGLNPMRELRLAYWSMTSVLSSPFFKNFILTFYSINMNRKGKEN